MITFTNGRFRGEFDSIGDLPLWDVLKWKISTLFKTTPNHKPLPVFRNPDLLHTADDFICWLGHASFLLQLDGKRILIDPVFWDIPFYKRDIPSPYSPAELGTIDYLLISHTHYDHFDRNSIASLSSQIKQAIIPLKMTPLLQRIIPNIMTQELYWYQSFCADDLHITLIPAKHWSRRRLFDKNTILWGGFVITSKNHTIYFAGDTAYGKHFKEIGKHFNIDIALLPIGAYKPKKIMQHHHLDPKEAYCAFCDLDAKTMIPMHYGTFNLSDEALDEPLSWMQKISTDTIKHICFLPIGETFIL
jgi:L-ascorbate metabolism protein UlaG (beta-lactamase superfamily)